MTDFFLANHFHNSNRLVPKSQPILTKKVRSSKRGWITFDVSDARKMAVKSFNLETKNETEESSAKIEKYETYFVQAESSTGGENDFYLILERQQ